MQTSALARSRTPPRLCLAAGTRSMLHGWSSDGVHEGRDSDIQRDHPGVAQGDPSTSAQGSAAAWTGWGPSTAKAGDVRRR